MGNFKTFCESSDKVDAVARIDRTDLEVWSMTQKDYINNYALKGAIGRARTLNKSLGKTFHKHQVIKAIKEGKKVPEHVLVDYKDSQMVQDALKGKFSKEWFG